MCGSLIAGSLIMTFLAPVPDQQSLIPVTVRLAAPEDPIRSGSSIPLTIVVHNGLAGPLEYHSFAIEPNEWNGETVSLHLEDIYRAGVDSNRYLASPEAKPPLPIAGMRRYIIKPGAEQTIRIDATKWKIRDGWIPGTYTVNVRVSLSTEDGRCKLAVLSNEARFTIEPDK